MRSSSIASPVLISAICFLSAITTSPIAFATTQANDEDDRSADKFGIDEIYPTDGPEWYLNEENPEGDGLFYHGSLKKLKIEDKGDGVWEVDARTGTPRHGVRLHVDSPEGSWKNVEMTGYIRFVEGANDQFSWLARNGQYYTNGGCDATGYYGILSYDGTVYFLKKTYHFGGGYTDRAALKQGVVEDLRDGRWIGIKFMAYNVGENNVKLELWLDDSGEGNNWRKVNEYQDDGQWNTQEMHCGRPQNYVVTDATERVTFRVDDTKFQFKDLSVREIDAGSGDSGQIEDENEDTSSDREDNDQEESRNQITPERKSEKDADEQPEADEEREDRNDESSEDSEQDSSSDTEDEEQKDSSEEENNDSVTAPKEDDTGDGVEPESRDAADGDNNTQTDDGSAVSEEEQDDESATDEEEEETPPSNDQDDDSLESEETSADDSDENEEEDASTEELSSEDEDTEATDGGTDETEDR
jgi:hypothetical protein